MTPAALVGLMMVALAAPPPAVQTVDKASCVAAHEAAQDFRQRGLRAQTREQLLLCVDPRCPGLVAAECRTLLADIDLPAPANDNAGSSPAPPSSEAEAAQPPPDPGERNSVGAVASPAEEPEATMSGGRAPEPPRARAVAAAPLRNPPPSGPPRASLLPGGLAVVALAGAAFLGWRGLSQAADLRRTCSPDCDPSQVSPVRRQLLIADLSLVAGLGLGAVTAWIIWSDGSRETGAAPSSASRGRSAPGTGWSLVPGLSALRVEYGGRF